MKSLHLQPLQFEKSLKERVWGGRQLADTASGPPIGEAWILHEDQAVVSGPLAGQTLAQLTRDFPEELLGQGRTDRRFPLLLKLLDCQDWLSVQVHPDDQHARQMVGPGENGKTEAWHILNAEPGAKVIAGTKEGVNLAQVQQAILAGQVAHLTTEREVQAGETLTVPAGTLHALGPGLLIYEIQQNSDTTYRVYDWDRPAAAGRELHLSQSAQVVKVGTAALTPAPGPQASQLLSKCEYFQLDQVSGQGERGSTYNTGGQSFHVLTVKTGQMTLSTAENQLTLKPYDTVLLPAALGSYTLSGDFTALRGHRP